MNTAIFPVDYSKVKMYKKQAEAEGIKFCKDLEWYGIYKIVNHTITNMLGFGALEIKKNYAIHKCDFIFTHERLKGYHTELIEYKNNLCKDKGLNYVEAICTKAAVKTHTNLGAKILRKSKNGSTKVKHEIK